ncbi:acyltransferase [Labilibaculum euxinus]
MRKINRFWRRYIKLRSSLIIDGPIGDRARGRLYEPFLKSYGDNFKVGTNAFIYNPNGLIVGNHVYVGFNSYIGQGEVELKDEVLIGNFVSITASNHLRKDGSFRFGGFESKEIVVGKGVWIAAHCSITAGVVIGSGSLVAAGSVVTKSFGKNLIIGGIPAKKIKDISDEN